MSHSFSGIKKRLEQEFLCDSLKGRISYFMTSYSKAHDNEGRVAIRVDGVEVLKGSQFKEVSISEGTFNTHSFTNALEKFFHMDIKDSINSDNYLIRLLAILDRRVGKRTLTKLVDQLEEQPDWLKYFYKLRLSSENITL